MTRSILRNALAIAAGLSIAATALLADATKQALPTVKVNGVDNVCDSFTLSTDSTGLVLTCVPTGSTPVGAPQGCVAAINSSSSVTLSSTGGSVNLAVLCSTTTGLTYNWSRNGAPGASSASAWTDAASANALLGPNSSTVDKISSYQVQVCNGNGCVTVPQSPLTATVSTAQNTGGWNGTCQGFAKTIVMSMDWAAPTRLYTASFNNMHYDDAVVVRFTTGNVETTNSLPRIAGAEYQSQPSARVAALSATPCDFDPQQTVGAYGQSVSVTMVFAISPGTGFGYYPVLQKNTTYYLNIKNAPNATCASNNVCDMFVDLVKPGGL